MRVGTPQTSFWTGLIKMCYFSPTQKRDFFMSPVLTFRSIHASVLRSWEIPTPYDFPPAPNYGQHLPIKQYQWHWVATYLEVKPMCQFSFPPLMSTNIAGSKWPGKHNSAWHIKLCAWELLDVDRGRKRAWLLGLQFLGRLLSNTSPTWDRYGLRVIFTRQHNSYLFYV